MKRIAFTLIFLIFLVGCSGQNTSVGILPSNIKTLICDLNNECVDILTDLKDNHFLRVDSTTPSFKAWNHYFNLETVVVSTTTDISLANSKTLNLTSVIGFNVGDKVDIHNGTMHIHTYREIIAINGNQITLDAGIDNDNPNGSQIDQTSFNMAVDGSVTPQIFTMKPRGNEDVDIVRLTIQIVDGTAADDSKFGGAVALTNGVHIRKAINNGTSYETITIWKSNKDMKEDMFDIIYSSKAGAGNFGVNGRWSFNKAEYVISLNATNNEWIEFIVQDDLTVLVDLQVKMQGHFN